MVNLQQEKDLLMMRKHAAEELASNPAQRKKFYADEVKKLQTHQAVIAKEQSDCVKAGKLVSQNLAMLKERLDQNLAQTAQCREEIQQERTKVEGARQQQRQVATKVREGMFGLNEVELKASSNKTKLTSLNQALDKVEPIYATLRRLQALAKQKESQCFKGLLIDYIECKP